MCWFWRHDWKPWEITNEIGGRPGDPESDYRRDFQIRQCLRCGYRQKEEF